MKKQTIKSLIAFLIFNSTFLFSAKAQIVYTDVIPDITKNTNGAVYHLDLNNDILSDFDIAIQTGNSTTPPPCGSGTKPYARIIITLVAGNFVATTSTSSSALISGAIINSTSTWSSSGALQKIMAQDWWQCVSIGGGNPHLFHFTDGPWLNATDKYLGLKFTSGGNTYYGWARLNAQVTSNATATFTIKDYAYNSIPNQQILAGQKCSPQATIKANGPLSFCSGDSVVLTSKNSGNTLKYQWKKNNVNINGATSKSYTVTTAGDYKVKVTDTINNCHKTSGIKTIMVPCRNSNETIVERLEHLSVYPNPATNSVTLKIPSDEAGEILIINLFGRVVETHNYASLRDGELQIDVLDFPAGMYVMRWSSGENYETKTFSVIK